jgi:transcriptional regulator with XRE-family HTH domain
MKKMNKARLYSSPLLEQILNSIPQVHKEKIGNKLSIAARIDDYMLQAGINKTELARRLSKNPSEITKWLSGTHNFTIDTLTEIAFELKVSIADLCMSKQEMTKKPDVTFIQITDTVSVNNPVTPWFDPSTMPYYAMTKEPEILYGQQKEKYA